jgi:hypothetical protein
MWEYRWVLFENVLLQIGHVGASSPGCVALPLFGAWNNSDASSAVLLRSTAPAFCFETPDLLRLFFPLLSEILDLSFRILSDSRMSSVSDAFWLSSEL